MHYRNFLTTGLLSCCLCLCGCSGGTPFPIARVSGTVTFEGKPVTGGSIRFVPASKGGKEAGKVAIGIIQSDGTFTLSSYGNGDGATVGMGKISYTEPPSTAEPPPNATPETWKPPVTPYANLTPTTPDVNVTEGENNLAVELVRRKTQRRSR